MRSPTGPGRPHLAAGPAPWQVEAQEDHRPPRRHELGVVGRRLLDELARERLGGHGLDVRVPGPAERAEVNRVIFEELALGKVLPASKARYLAIMEEPCAEGAEAVVAGCTEVGMLVQQRDLVVPYFDTTELHCRAAAEWAMGGG